jgi:hypothetical protein
MEHTGAPQSAVFQSIEEKIRTNVESALEVVVERQIRRAKLPSSWRLNEFGKQ